MPSRPSFVDNRDQTLAAAIAETVAYYREQTGRPPTLDVATGYFDPGGYAAVSGVLDDVQDVRLLLGAEPLEKDRTEWSAPGAARGAAYDGDRVETALARLEEDLREDRDLLGFSRGVDDTLQGLLSFLDREDVAVRRYEEGFLHGKAYVFDGEAGVLAGSSNFTGAGLSTNLELNLGAYDPRVTDDVASWFEELWRAATPYDLASVYEARFEPYDPHLLYLRLLYERYGDRLEEETPGASGEIELTNFQRHGAARALRFLEEHDGVLVGDEVGLGKTYVAGKLLEEYVEHRRQHALVVAPAYLRDGMWRNVREEWGLRFDVLSYAELRQEPRLDPERTDWTPDETSLEFHPDEYQLVVVDEGHAFRNPQTEQSRALRRLLRGTPSKDVVFVTATPVNNSLWDLYYLLSYFLDDAAFADEGITSLRERFETAQAQNPAELSPDLLFDVLDRTTVRRTRRFVRRRYENSTLPDGEGGQVPITFPEPDPRRVDYTFGETFDDDFFASIARGLGGREGADGDPELGLARYQPRSILEGESDGAELSLVGLLRTGLLKRFESSSRAFAVTLDRMIDQYQSALKVLSEGYVPETDAIAEWTEATDDAAFAEAFDRADAADLEPLADDHDAGALWERLQSDLSKLEYWHDRVAAVTPDDDEKLARLRDTLAEIAAEADAAATGEADARQKRKVVIFSYFEDTVEWITAALREAAATDDRLADYEGRIAAVSGDGVGRVSQATAIQGFAPASTDAPEGTEDRFDVLVTTDVLGQGVNLQQARNVVNYDLPWNPMRVVQRNGRVDRIGSPHDTVRPHTFFPEDRLDDFLQLENRVRRKLTQAAQSVGLDNEVIPGMETQAQNFADREAQIESLADEEAAPFREGHAEAAAFSGEEFRQRLRDGLERRREAVESLPWGAGSGLRGDRPGYVFCARVGDEEFLRFVPTDETGRVADDTDTVTDSLAVLRRAECDPGTERHLPETMRANVYDAWHVARESVREEWNAQTDPRDLQPSVPKVLRQARDHLVEHPPASVTRERLETVTDAVAAPLGRRYQREFRAVLEDDSLSPTERSERIVETAADIGLQPSPTPEAREPVADEEIRLVCWLAVSPRA